MEIGAIAVRQRHTAPLTLTACRLGSAPELSLERERAMPTIFFSWQLDRPAKTGRNLVEKALRQAIDDLSDDLELEAAIRDELAFDKDTQGVPGSPPIAETIFTKIDAAAVFVPDLTFVGTRVGGRPVPNPNVLIEYGWALKALKHERIVAVMNAAHGEPSAATLPFDMMHLRHPITYNCPDDADEATRRAARLELTRSLRTALKTLLGFHATKVVDDAPPPFAPRNPEDGLARFRNAVEPLGALHDPLIQLRGEKPSMIHLKPGAAMWLRVMPQHALATPFRTTDIEQAFMRGGSVPCPLNWHDGRQLHSLRGHDGFGVCATTDGETTPAVIYCFPSGEVWTVDTTYLDSDPKSQVHFSEGSFAHALRDGSRLLQRLGIAGPFRWIAGLEGVKHRSLTPVGHAYTVTPPPFLVDAVTQEGTYSGEEADALAALEPFFHEAYDKAHLRRPKS